MVIFGVGYVDSTGFKCGANVAAAPKNHKMPTDQRRLRGHGNIPPSLCLSVSSLPVNCPIVAKFASVYLSPSPFFPAPSHLLIASGVDVGRG